VQCVRARMDTCVRACVRISGASAAMMIVFFSDDTTHSQ